MLKRNLSTFSLLLSLGFIAHAAELAAAPNQTKQVELTRHVENICHESISHEGIRLACQSEFELCHQSTWSQFNKFLQDLGCDPAGADYYCTEQAWQDYLHKTSELLFTYPPDIVAADHCLEVEEANSCQFRKIYGVEGCIPHVCGDGVVVPEVEECDDSNHQNGDGCTAECLTEKQGTQPQPPENPTPVPSPSPIPSQYFLQGSGCTVAIASGGNLLDWSGLGLALGLGIWRILLRIGK